MLFSNDTGKLGKINAENSGIYFLFMCPHASGTPYSMEYWGIPKGSQCLQIRIGYCHIVFRQLRKFPGDQVNRRGLI